MAYANNSGMPAPMVYGAASRNGIPFPAALATTALDAALESCQMFGHLWWADGGSHTIDTTGSSSIQWRASTVTFAAAAGASTFTVGLATLDATTGPAMRATNVADAITFTVGKTYVSATDTITTNVWQTTVPTTGTSGSLATGTLIGVCFQMVTRSGADSVLVASGSSNVQSMARPCVTDFTGGSYTNSNHIPNVVLVASDGTLGYILGGAAWTIGTTATTWNNTSGQKEYGNILQFPYPVRIFGAAAGISITGDCSINLYSDPLNTTSGSPGVVAERTVAIDLNQVSASTTPEYVLFATPYDLAANTNIGIVAQPTSATNVSMSFGTFNAATHQTSLATTGYAISRATVSTATTFVDTNSSKDRYSIGLLLSGFDNGAGAGGVSGSRIQLGM